MDGVVERRLHGSLALAMNVSALLASAVAAMAAPIQDASPVYFAAAWGPMRVVAQRQCTSGGCVSVAHLFVREPSSAEQQRCSSRIKTFPDGVVLASKWIEVHGDPVLLFYVAATEAGPGVEHAFRPELDCTYSASWLSGGDS